MLSEQNSFTEMEYPLQFTYKVMGDDTEDFRDSVLAVFAMKEVLSVAERKSKSGKYVSLSVTVDIENHGELKTYYEMISQIEGLKYHL